ncbi:MAG: hypothetical protein R3D90_00110 [Paracoccaceae bacterium]
MLRRKSAEDRKTEIIAAVLDLADRIGPDRLTTNDIAQEVGVTSRYLPALPDKGRALDRGRGRHCGSAGMCVAAGCDEQRKPASAIKGADCRAVAAD